MLYGHHGCNYIISDFLKLRWHMDPLFLLHFQIFLAKKSPRDMHKVNVFYIFANFGHIFML